MEFWKTEEEYRVIQRIEVLDKIECDQCGCIITRDSTDDTYIRATTTVCDGQCTVKCEDWCKKCAIELTTREFLSHQNPNIGFSVDIRHLRKRSERMVEENAKTNEPIDGSML